MNIKRLKVLIIIIFSVIVLATLTYLVYLNTASKRAGNEYDGVRAFSENFIGDYSTFKVSNPDIYNQKVSTYISPDYLESFQEKHQLGPVKAVDTININNYSKYKSSNIKVKKGLKTGEFGVTIDYQVEKLDKSWKSSTFTEDHWIELTVIEINDQYYIKNFAFTRD